jgi:hemoglobin
MTEPENPRRAALIQRIQAETGIDEDMIFQLVHAFYGRVRQDPLIGPVFAARISDWEPHLQRMCEFWSSVMLMSGRYHGAPMPKHAALPIDAPHFDRWLELFTATAHEVCPPAAAERFVERARLIARSLEMGVANSQGVFLDRTGRFHRTGSAPE